MFVLLNVHVMKDACQKRLISSSDFIVETSQGAKFKPLEKILKIGLAV